MSSAQRFEAQSVFAGINVTPLVDITLVLLIIFMVTARLISSQTLPMDLPKAATGSAQQEVFSVTLLASGEVLAQARPASEQQVVALARDARATHPEIRAVIKADASVAHGRVVRTIDLLRQGGIGRIAFGITPALADSVNTR